MYLFSITIIKESWASTWYAFSSYIHIRVERREFKAIIVSGGGRGGGGREASSEGSLAEATPDTDESAGAVGSCGPNDHRHRPKRRHHQHPQPQHSTAHELHPKVLLFAY